MDGKLVLVHHGEHRVEVHEGAGSWEMLKARSLRKVLLWRGPSPARASMESSSGPLGNAHRQHLGGEHQDVAALQGGGPPRSYQRGAFGRRVVLKDELAEEGLPVAGNGVHPVDGHAGADGGEGIR